jgi:enoyl-CoA hydratase
VGYNAPARLTHAGVSPKPTKARRRWAEAGAGAPLLLPMPDNVLLLDRDGAIATITFNRPAVMNALDQRTLTGLDAAVAELDADPAVRVVLITGAGEKAFVAGADITELARLTPLGGRELALRGQAVFARIERASKPVIAVINGYCLGGGCELALACTFRFASATAQIGQPEIDLGIVPGYGGSQRLSRLVGLDRALDLILTGRRVGADEAMAMGLVTRVFPPDRLLDEARAFARVLAAKAPVAVHYAMRAIRHGLDVPLAEGLEHEATLFGLVFATEDMKEGTRAFLEKRKAEWKAQ